MTDSTLPHYQTLRIERTDRLLTVEVNRPELLNAVNLLMLTELSEVFIYAASDPHSDVVLLTGAGRAFSAGGDLEHIAGNAEHPERFEHEARLAKKIIFSMLDLEKPLICRLNGHAVGLGATLALMCDVIFAVDSAKIGDPHVALGLVAGDGGMLLSALGELSVIRREAPDLVIIVCNDGSYGAEHIQFRDQQLDPAITLFDWPDFVSVARSLGGDGTCVTSTADLDALPEAIDSRDRTRPYLIDVRLDPDRMTMW